MTAGEVLHTLQARDIQLMVDGDQSPTTHRRTPSRTRCSPLAPAQAALLALLVQPGQLMMLRPQRRAPRKCAPQQEPILPPTVPRPSGGRAFSPRPPGLALPVG